MDSLTLKIQSFVNQVSSAPAAADSTSPNALKMVKYFEEEYKLQMMSFLENEWVAEQVERDLTDGAFKDLRSHVPANRRPEFDQTVSMALLGD